MRVAVFVTLLASAVVANALTVAPTCTQVPGVTCTKTIGFWKSNPHRTLLQFALTAPPGNVPIGAVMGSTIMLGSSIPISNVAQALYILNKGGNGDNPILNMAAQLLAALLNQKMGSWIPTNLSDGSNFCQVETNALAWLNNHVTTTPTGWSNPQTGMTTPTSLFFDGISSTSLPAGWATSLDEYNNDGEDTNQDAQECWDGSIDPVTLPSEDSCVDLPHGFECDKPHEDLTGPCLEVVTSTSSFRATGDHLIHTPEQGWRLVRELKEGDVLRTGIVESVKETICKSLNSCQTEDRKFDAFGEVFAQNALITPDNYLTMLIH